MTDFHLGDIVRLKKPHPCGGYEWEILRLGADFRLRCTTCGRQVMLARREVERRMKKLFPSTAPDEEEE